MYNMGGVTHNSWDRVVRKIYVRVIVLLHKSNFNFHDIHIDVKNYWTSVKRVNQIRLLN